MRKLLLLLLLEAAGAAPLYADTPTDWLNFAPAQDGEVAYSVRFANFGKMYFENSGMRYKDESSDQQIPYSAAGYIFFSAESQLPEEVNSVLGITKGLPSLSYRSAIKTVELVADGNASCITLYNMQGEVIDKVFDTNSISVEAPIGSMVIAVAEYQGENIAKKIIVE